MDFFVPTRISIFLPTGQMFSLILELVILSHQTDQAKELEILLQRWQLAMVERKLDKPLRVSRARLQQPEDGLDVEICWEASSTTTIVKRRDPIFLLDGIFGTRVRLVFLLNYPRALMDFLFERMFSSAS